MSTDPITQAISAELRIAEELIDQHIGWNDALCTVFGLFGDPAANAARTVMLPVEPNWALRLPESATPLPAAFVLHHFAETLARDLPSWLPRWRRANGDNLLGAAFLCEAWVTPAYDDYQYGDLRQVSAMAQTEARLLIAVDLGGRLYELIRKRGQRPTLTVTEKPTAAQREARIPAAVYQLAAALRPA